MLLHAKVKFSTIENYFSLKLHCVDLANVMHNTVYINYQNADLQNKNVECNMVKQYVN